MPACYLHVWHSLYADPDSPEFLVVRSSRYAVFEDPGMERALFHYDYIRRPEHDYPAAHLQVTGDDEILKAICRRADMARDLDRLHFPVGGRRFRPSLEDVLEFLVVEGFANPRDDWRDALERHRGDFHRLQLRATVRRDPEAAVAQLRAMGYVITAPADQPPA